MDFAVGAFGVRIDAPHKTGARPSPELSRGFLTRGLAHVHLLAEPMPVGCVERDALDARFLACLIPTFSRGRAIGEFERTQIMFIIAVPTTREQFQKARQFDCKFGQDVYSSIVMALGGGDARLACSKRRHLTVAFASLLLGLLVMTSGRVIRIIWELTNNRAHLAANAVCFVRRIRC